MSRARTWMVPLLGLGLGCASVERLSERREFVPALCAAETGRNREADLQHVRDRIDEEARPRLHLFAVPPIELERSLGPAGARLAREAAVVRAVAAIDDVDVDDFSLRVLLVGPEGPIEPIPAHVERIAAYTGERIPPPEVQVITGRREMVPSRFRQRPLMGITAAVLEASTLFIVPVTEFTGHTRRTPDGRVVSEPSEAEIAAVAPAASMLAAEAARRSHVAYERGTEVSSVWLWPRPPEGELKLVVEWSYSAYGCASHQPALRRAHTTTAEVRRVVEIPLPPGPDLEHRLAAVFGERVRPLLR